MPGLTRPEAQQIMRDTMRDVKEETLVVDDLTDERLLLIRAAMLVTKRWNNPRPGPMTGLRNALRREMELRHMFDPLPPKTRDPRCCPTCGGDRGSRGLANCGC